MVESVYSGGEHLEILREARNYNSFLVQEVLRQMPQGSKTALDFGAGIGTFSEMIREEGIEVQCVENDPGLQKRLGAKGFLTSSSLKEIASESLPFIYTLNVLEHILDHEAVIKELARCLKAGGILYIYVPAFDVLYSTMDKMVGHHRRYKISTLCPLLERAGLKVESARYVDSMGYLATLIYKYFGDEEGRLSPWSVKIYDRVLFPFSLLCDIFFHKFFGKNLSVRAVKEGKK